MSVYDVSFFTCCYEADWECLLIEGRLKKMIDLCNYTFVSKNLVINNVEDKEKILKYANQAKADGIIDNFYFSEDSKDKILQDFSIKRRNFKLDGFDGYWYSVGPLTSIYLCSSTFLLYFASDCILSGSANFNWVHEGSKILNNNNNVLCITPTWDYNKDEPKTAAIFEDKICYYDRGFSDQVFLIFAKNFKSDIYNEYNKGSEIFPIYGGNHFERRVFCYLNNHHYLRGVLKIVYYRHDKLVKPGYVSTLNNNNLKNYILYTISRFKKKFRKRNLFVKHLLR
jgi:hypothetical protein